MQTDWEEGKPPTYLDVDVYAFGAVRRGAFDGVCFHFSDGGNPMNNAVCRAEEIEAWKYTPGDNEHGKSLLNQRLQMSNWKPATLSGYLPGLIGAALGPL